MSEAVAIKLKLLREGLGWSQEHLAEAAGVSGRTVQRAENGDDLSGETLQALASAFEMNVAQLTMPLPSDEELKQALAQMHERYRFTPLKRVERPTDLHAAMGQSACQVDYVDGLSDTQYDAIAALEELLRDYGEAWSDIGPTDRLEAVRTIYAEVEGLHASGLMLAAGAETMRLNPAGPESVPMTFNVARFVVSRVSEPRLFAVRDKKAPVQFA